MRLTMAVATLAAGLLLGSAAGRADHCMGQYLAGIERLKEIGAEIEQQKAAGGKGQISCATGREVAGILKLLGGIQEDACQHASNSRRIGNITEVVLRAKQLHRQLRKEMKGKC